MFIFLLLITSISATTINPCYLITHPQVCVHYNDGSAIRCAWCTDEGGQCWQYDNCNQSTSPLVCSTELFPSEANDDCFLFYFTIGLLSAILIGFIICLCVAAFNIFCSGCCRQKITYYS